MKKSAKRLLALILAMAMALSLLSASVWAAEESDPASSAPAEVEVQENPQAEEAPEDESAPEEKADESAPEEKADESAPEEEPEAAPQEDESQPEPQEEEAPEDESQPEPQEEEAPEDESSPEPQGNTEGQCGDNLTWKLENGVLTIDGTGAMWDFSYNDSPMRLKEASQSTSWNSYSVVKIVIKSGVTSVGNNAFRKFHNLKQVVFEGDSSVERIGDYAFANCCNYPESIKDIRIAAAYNGSITGLYTITLPNSVKSIGEGAFSGCMGLHQITLPQGLKPADIGKDAFAGCYNLEEVVNGQGLEECFSDTAWANEDEKKWAELIAGAIEMKDEEKKTITVPATATEPTTFCIKYVPSKNTNVPVYSPESENCSFASGMALADATSRNFPAFDEDGELYDSYYFYAGETYYFLINACVQNPSQPGSFTVSTQKYITSGTFINDDGEEISWSFSNGTLTISGKGVVDDDPWWDYPSILQENEEALTAVVVKDGITGFGENGIRNFQGCPELTSVTLADSVNSMWDADDSDSIQVFAYCPKLTTVTMKESNFYQEGAEPKTPAEIRQTFYFLDSTPWLVQKLYPNTQELKLGQSVDVTTTAPQYQDWHMFRFTAPEDGYYMFSTSQGSGCYPDGDVTSFDELINTAEASADGPQAQDTNSDPSDEWHESRPCTKGAVLYVKVSSALPGTFQLTTQKVEPPTSGKCGRNLTWTYADGTLTISGKGKMNTSYLDFSAWRALSSLVEKLVLEEGVTGIGSGVFTSFEDLSEVSFPSTLRTIGSSAFTYCRSLTELEFNEGLREIGDSAFEGCAALKSVSLPEGLVTVGYEAFYGCSMQHVTIPASVESVGPDAFGYRYVQYSQNPYQPVYGFTIYGKAGSEAETYASYYSYNNFRFVEHESHNWGEPKWTWAADYSTAKASFSCSVCQDKRTFAAAVTSAEADGKITYTAAVELGGKSWTDTKQVDAPQQNQPNPQPQPVEPQANTIKTADTVFFTYNTKKAQKKTLSVKVKGGAKLTFKSNSKKVKVNKNGKVTVPKKFKGKAKITITAAATDSYKAAKKTVLIMVGPSATKLDSVKGAKGSFTASWKKNKMAKAYKVQYSTKKDFSKKVKSVKVKGAKSVTTTVKLKKGTYYVRLRTEDGSTYSKWSKVVKVKVK